MSVECELVCGLQMKTVTASVMDALSSAEVYKEPSTGRSTWSSHLPLFNTVSNLQTPAEFDSFLHSHFKTSRLCERQHHGLWLQAHHCPQEVRELYRITEAQGPGRHVSQLQ